MLDLAGINDECPGFVGTAGEVITRMRTGNVLFDAIDARRHVVRRACAQRLHDLEAAGVACGPGCQVDLLAICAERQMVRPNQLWSRLRMNLRLWMRLRL